MVKNGDFSVALVEAETKTKFQEHTAADGKVYVEVEPDIEYFIRVASTANSRVIICTLSVDGEGLGYDQPIGSHEEPLDLGLWSRVQGQSIQTALKFCKSKVSLSGPGVERPMFWTGEVLVEFYEAIEEGYKLIDNSDYKSSWKGGNVGHVMGVSDPTKKKGIKAGEGTVTEVKALGQSGVYHKRGKVLETIRLNYCSALGLIHAGVLPKPPLWDLHRLTNPRTRDDDVEPLPEAKKMRTGAELFDLSSA